MGNAGNMNNLMKTGAENAASDGKKTRKHLKKNHLPQLQAAVHVEVTVSGKREVTGVKLSEEVVDRTILKMLEDLIVCSNQRSTSLK